MLDATKFMEALDELETEKGISKDAIINALKEAMKKAYCKTLKVVGSDDADVRVTIESEPKPFIKMEYAKRVVADVQDDFLEIDIEDAKKIDPSLEVGQDYVVEVPVDDLKRVTAMTVKSVLRQKISDVEKQALYESHKGKIGEMLSGMVEKCDDRGAIVNIGRTSVFLSRRDLIGDETFKPGTPIRMFVSNVSTNEKGPMIKVSRSDVGFLRRLFEEQVPDFYNGTVVIKAMAREAGMRAKVAVQSNDSRVDAVLAFIGRDGSVIQNVVSQLGNSKDKEKIDIISYTPNIKLFIVDAMRPASVTYLSADEETKTATVIVPDGQLSLAIGRKGSNARVACQLTGWKINVKEEKDKAMLEAGDVEVAPLTFVSVEALQEEERNRIGQEVYKRHLEEVKLQRAMQQTTIEAGFVKAKPQQITDDFVNGDSVKTSVPVVEEVKVEEKPVVEEVKVEEEVVTPRVVKTTTTLESLEKALQDEKKKRGGFKATNKSSRRPRNISEDEVAHEEVKEVAQEVKKPQMDIYTEEEKEQLANEILEEDIDFIDEEDIDYDDFDKYYEDDK